MPPSLQIDNTGITTWEDLDANVKRSRLQFSRDSAETDPYLHVSMGNSATAVRITNIATPTASSDVTNKAYVDSKVQGLTIKSPVRVVAVTAGALDTAYAAGQTVDGVTLVAGDRILLSAQTNAIENGVWVVAATGAPSRAADIPAGVSYGASGVYVFVDEGTIYKDRSFVCTSDKGADVVGTNELAWVQFGARPSAYKGFGLAMGAANALDVDYTVIPVLANNQTFTGNNTFSGTMQVNNTITTTGTLTAPKVTNLTTASITGNTDAVNLEYLNNALTSTVNGQQAKSAAQVASQTNIELSALIPTATVGGVTLVTGDRVLLVGQTSAIDNGLYVVNATGPATRTTDMPTGSQATGAVVAVSRGDSASKLYLCTNTASADTVGTDALTFLPVGHTLTALAGTSLTGNLTDLRLDVRTDNSTIETDGTNNQLRLKDSGITNVKIADSTIANVKLVNNQVQVKVNRGLKRTTTNGTVTSAAVTDTTAPSDYGLSVPLGMNVGVEPDFTVVPDLAASNTFTSTNTFTGSVTVSSSTASTSQTTGALVVTGGVGIGGNVYCSNSYNMSDQRLKDNVEDIGDIALEKIDKIRGVHFVWKQDDVVPDILRGTPAVGVIAQEVQKEAPLAVSTNEVTGMLAVEYTRLTPYLIEAVKTLKRKCDELQLEVSTLKRLCPSS